MIPLDDRLTALRAQAGEWAAGFRTHALALDADPEHVTRLTGLPGVVCMSTLGVPPEFGGPGIRAGRHRFDGMSALERAVILEEFAWGDAGLLLGSPGPSMSGVLLDRLGDDAQKGLFFGRVLARPTWTFFALTEPEHGSDATAIATSAANLDGELAVDGVKRYIGNGARASMGVTFCRTAAGPFGLSAVLVDTGGEGFTAEPLPMLGLRGAQITQLTFDGVRAGADRVLGRHLPATRRGMWGFLQVFNRLRPQVAAMAVGVARAACDYLAAERPHVAELDIMRLRLDATRALVHQAARAADATGDGQPASLAKLSACELAGELTLQAAALLGPAARLEHPLLDKFIRDARGLEFMEGTSNIQKLNVFPALLAHDLR